MPDIKSSSESMVSGVGGETAAEAVLLLARFAGLEVASASAAFLFLFREEMVPFFEGSLRLSRDLVIAGIQGCIYALW